MTIITDSGQQIDGTISGKHNDRLMCISCNTTYASARKQNDNKLRESMTKSSLPAKCEKPLRYWVSTLAPRSQKCCPRSQDSANPENVPRNARRCLRSLRLSSTGFGIYREGWWESEKDLCWCCHAVYVSVII